MTIYKVYMGKLAMVLKAKDQNALLRTLQQTWGKDAACTAIIRPVSSGQLFN
jgi:hypothetical protein